MSRIADFLSNIWESIKELPGKIVNGIIEGLKSLFIPDTNNINSNIEELSLQVQQQFGISTGQTYGSETNVFNLGDLFEQEAEPEDITETYYINGLGNVRYTFIDLSFFKQGVEYFRPIIRGVLILWMFFYNMKQAFLTFKFNSGIDESLTGISKTIRGVKNDH